MVLLVLAQLGCSLVPSSEAELPADPAQAMRQIAATYQTEYRLGASAVAPATLFLLCYMPTPGTDVSYHAAATEPRDGETRITVYANPPAWAPFHQEGERVFPDGSVLVKQKSDGGVGIMEKRQGAWRYGYVSPEGEVAVDAGATGPCASCHEHGTVPESAKTFSPVGVRLNDPRDGVFLSATE